MIKQFIRRSARPLGFASIGTLFNLHYCYYHYYYCYYYCYYYSILLERVNVLLNGFGLQSLLRKLGLNTGNLVRETILKRLRCL